MKSKLILSLNIVITLLASATVSASNKPLESLSHVIKKGNVYVISRSVDLNEGVVQISPNSTIQFIEGGFMYNGTIVGDNTKVKADNDIQVFSEDLKIQGTWNNSKVYSEWVGLQNNESENDNQFSNLMTLCNGPSMTHLYVQDGDFFVSAHKESAPIILPSNIYWHNKARIHMMPTDLGKYSIVLAAMVDNVTIDGGEFIGDIIDHTGTTGEWGHGIKCAGATNVTLKNLRCSYCWGDGIDLIEGRDKAGEATINCNNINIHNVACEYNRRQGLSIEAAQNVNITNCRFTHTGRIKTTAPSAGIDIEPWNDNADKVVNINIVNCLMEDNVGFDLQCEPNVQKRNRLYGYKELMNNISLKNCTIGKTRIQYTNGFTTYKCKFNESMLIQNADGLIFKKSYIHQKSIKNEENLIKMKRCKGDIALCLLELGPCLSIGALLLAQANRR